MKYSWKCLAYINCLSILAMKNEDGSNWENLNDGQQELFALPRSLMRGAGLFYWMTPLRNWPPNTMTKMNKGLGIIRGWKNLYNQIEVKKS
jgi:hypothetical protein